MHLANSSSMWLLAAIYAQWCYPLSLPKTFCEVLLELPFTVKK